VNDAQLTAGRQRPASIGREHRTALVVCLTAGFIAFLDVSIVNVALPTISTHLHASGSGLQWIVSGYALAFGLLLLTDRHRAARMHADQRDHWHHER
jgi:hypothetical protein